MRSEFVFVFAIVPAIFGHIAARFLAAFFARYCACLSLAMMLLLLAVVGLPIEYWWLVALGLINAGAVLYRSSYPARSAVNPRSKYADGCCRVCGYNLRENVSGICPECGIDTKTALRKRKRKPVDHMTQIMLCAVVLEGLAVCIAWMIRRSGLREDAVAFCVLSFGILVAFGIGLLVSWLRPSGSRRL